MGEGVPQEGAVEDTKVQLLTCSSETEARTDSKPATAAAAAAAADSSPLLAPAAPNQGEEDAEAAAADTSLPPKRSRRQGRAAKRRGRLLSNDPPHDVFFSVALLTLLLMVLVREAMMLGPLALHALAHFPWAALGVLPALSLASLLAALGCLALLRGVKGASAQRLRVFSAAFVVVFAGLGALLLALVLRRGGDAGVQGQAVTAALNLGKGVELLLLAILALVGLVAYRKYFPVVSTLAQDSSTFLLTRGKAVLVLALSSAFLGGTLLLLPTLAAALGLAQDCASSFRNALSAVQVQSDKALSPEGTGGGALGFPGPSLESVWLALGSLEADAQCQPWVDALSPDESSSLVFAAISGFVLLWGLCLGKHSCVFVSASMLDQAQAEACDSQRTQWPHLREALRKCLVDSFGSLCLTSFLVTLTAGLLPALIALPVPFLRSPAALPVLMTVAAILQISATVFLSSLVVPGLAVFGTSFLSTSSSVVQLMKENLHQVLALPMAFIPLGLLLTGIVCLVLTMTGALASVIMLPILGATTTVQVAVILVLGPSLQVVMFSDILYSTVSAALLTALSEGPLIMDVEAKLLDEARSKEAKLEV